MHSTFFQLGRLHIPVFGVLAAVGVISALALSQRTARYARLDANAVWNSGATMVATAFVISRVLLVVFNWHSFLQYPVLLLALPSLTSTGVLLTSLFMLAYLRWSGLPLVAFLDAIAPCAALLWVFVCVARFVEGTREGMPTRLAWGISDGTTGKVHPVELYTLVSAALICLALLRALKVQDYSGSTAGIGLGLAGFSFYFIDWSRLPSDLLANAWLDPTQIVAIAMIVAGCALVFRREAKMQRVTGSEGRDAV